MAGRGLIAAVRPGPVLCVWRSGQEVARVPLDLPAALALLEALAREARAAAATHPEGGNQMRDDSPGSLFVSASRWAGLPAPPPPERHLGPILHDREERSGDRGLDPVWWLGRTWAVTAFGIERRDGRYSIPADRLTEHGEGYSWPEHICRKGSRDNDLGYDREDFRTAYLIACALHGHTVPRRVIEAVTARAAAATPTPKEERP